ncbi:leucine-rich repeat-containing protein egg-6-like isoform X1 [Atheta coriaria]|uniref:leucine-rich repeat-containing protein egg-6-like isoform X1 n=2 Tax=Dalotia coriaria TaxID=877792 RepID=UPI0031F3CC50
MLKIFLYAILWNCLFAAIVAGEQSEERILECKIGSGRRIKRSVDSPSLTICEPSPGEPLSSAWETIIIPQDRQYVSTLNAISCNLNRVEDLDHFYCYLELEKIVLIDLKLTKFNLLFVSNNPRLRTLILDDNPIESLENDAEITLEHLSMKNTSLTNLPNSSLKIFQHLKTLNITGRNFKDTHDKVCIKLEHLEMFNGVPCHPTLTPTDQTILIEVPEGNPEKRQNSLGTKLRPMSIMIVLITSICLLTPGYTKKWACLIILLACTYYTNAVTLFDQQEIIDKTDLHFESFGIRGLDDLEFTSLPALTHLYLSNNSLTRLNIQSESLTYLDVKNNEIQDVQNYDFNGLPNLKDLFLSGNAIKEINWNLDFNTPNIKRIDLSHNHGLRKRMLQELKKYNRRNVRVM